MKLHLGCGNKKINGYINVDIRSDVNPDLIDDVKILFKIKNESVDVIYASHVLEHIGKNHYLKTLQRWYEVLKPNGILRISVPDFESISDYYSKTKDLSKLRGLLYGGQTYKENYHFYIWDFKTLEEDLKRVNFKNIYRYDWKNTEHSDVDDFSQSYLPHMDKENGQLMCLNVEAIK